MRRLYVLLATQQRRCVGRTRSREEIERSESNPPSVTNPMVVYFWQCRWRNIRNEGLEFTLGRETPRNCRSIWPAKLTILKPTTLRKQASWMNVSLPRSRLEGASYGQMLRHFPRSFSAQSEFETSFLMFLHLHCQK